MEQIIKKASLILFFLSSIILSLNIQAAMNPYNKDKTYDFGSEIKWRSSPLGALKSGTYNRRGDDYYYHLAIDDQRLLLRIALNEPSGLKTSSRPLDQLSILDIIVDGQRLPQFQWCLDNRLNPIPFKIIKMDTRIKDNVCENRIEKGEFVVKLDSTDINALKKSSKLQIITKLSKKHLTTLNYDMAGFADNLKQFEIGTDNARKKASAPLKIKTNKTKAAISRKAKTCYAKPPAEFASDIKRIGYPCNDPAQQRQARNNIRIKVKQLKTQKKEEQQRQAALEKKRLAELAAQRKREEERLEKERLQKQRELEFEKMKTKMWVARCKKHWSKGVSPCFCKPYIKHAPAGTKNTCKK